MTGGTREPSDSLLARYVHERLARLGAVFAEREAVEETLATNRDLWLKLYEIDREFDDPTFDFNQPS